MDKNIKENIAFYNFNEINNKPNQMKSFLSLNLVFVHQINNYNRNE